MKSKQIKKITITALLSAICVLFHLYIKFPLPIFPSFLKFDFSMLPAILGGYIVGPVYGSLIVVIRFLIKVCMTHTAGVGEIADLIIGLCVILTSSMIYKFIRNKKGAIISLCFSTLVWVIVASLTNYFVLVPSYINLYFKGDVNIFVKTLSMIKGVNETNYMQKYILYAVVPFNALLSITVNIITFIVYKPLSGFINKMGKTTNSNTHLVKNNDKYNVIMEKEGNETNVTIHYRP